MSQIAKTHTRFGRRGLAALAALAGAALMLVPATQAAAQSVDLRSPDARDAARALHSTGIVDLRSPDARDAARAVQTTSVVDLRSPDARDAARPTQSTPVATGSPSGGFDWTYVAIGGGVAVLLLGAAGLARRRRSTAHRPVPIQS
jgi:hypothetical protein